MSVPEGGAADAVTSRQRVLDALAHRPTDRTPMDFGGIDLQHLLPHGTPGEIRAEVRRRCEIMGAQGGYLCAPAHSLPDDVPPQNLVAVYLD